MFTPEDEQKDVAQAEEALKLKRDSELSHLRTVLSNEAGLRTIWRIMEQCGTFESVFRQDINRMAYYSGKQDLGHWLQAEVLEADPNLYIKMMKMNNDKERK